ncbi:EboA domain-containing protein [Myxococcota bacterium]|nr:EboA domain-containing protein [Myxococcota bacterium]
MTLDAQLTALGEVLARRLGGPARAWLDAERAWIDGARSAGFDARRFSASFTAMTRRLGKAALALDDAEVLRLRDAGLEQVMARWSVDELGRAEWLVRGVALHAGDAAAALVRQLYDDGDNRERQAVLRALPLLPEPERFVALGVEACRSHVSPIFEAIACDNVYPARYFPDASFHQMALKVAFVELPLARVVLLATRKTAELDRMARDYAGERQAAGRPVPADLGLFLNDQTGSPR